MLRMESDGLIQLPLSTRTKQPVRKIEFTSVTDPQAPMLCPVNQLPQLHSQMITKTTSALSSGQTLRQAIFEIFLHRYNLLSIDVYKIIYIITYRIIIINRRNAK